MGVFVIIPIAVVIILVLSAAYVKAPPEPCSSYYRTSQETESTFGKGWI